jgi:uncharacterized protein
VEFVNEITVSASPEQVFEFLSDVERVAPCLPGASIQRREGDTYHGSLRLRVGPVTAQYHGTLRFRDLDSAQRRAEMVASATEAAGHGSAEATIISAVLDAGEGSLVRISTDLQIRGRVAQFGRGAIELVSEKMIASFATNLETAIRGGDGSPALASGSEGDSARASVADSGYGVEADPVNLFDALPQIRKAAVLAGAAAVGFGYGYLLGRLRGGER